MKNLHMRNKKKISRMGRRLLSDKTTIKEKTVIMMTLAHSPTQEALDILKEYNKASDTALKDLVPLAIEECEMWNE